MTELREALTELQNTMEPTLYKKYVECEIARLQNKLDREADYQIGDTWRHDHFRRAMAVHYEFLEQCLDSAENLD